MRQTRGVTILPQIAVETVGNEREPLAIVEGFAPDPDALRGAASAATFAAGEHHYPGIRAALPEGYMRDRMPLLARAIGQAFGRCRRVTVVDASFSIVTTPPADLTQRQRLPHVDAFGRERIALVHYLSPQASEGTAFFRHRATGFESVDEHRAPSYFARLDDELGDGAALPPHYVTGDTAMFERTMLVPARYNRAVLYRSYLLHSGAIDPASTLSADPALGRLTVTGFFSVES